VPTHGMPSAAEEVWTEMLQAVSASLSRHTLKDLVQRQHALGGESYSI